MKQAVFLLLVFLTAGIANAQVVRGGTAVPIPAPIPVYGPSMSVIDHSGNLLIFDVNYSYPRFEPGTPRILTRIPESKTCLTVIRNDGHKDAPKEFEGAVQIIGAGYYAVYIVLSTTTVNSTTESNVGISYVTKRQLMAINLDSTVQPMPLDVPLRADVRLSASADAHHLDTLSFVDPPTNPLILAPTGTRSTAPAVRRFARLITCDGKAFYPTDAIPLP